MVIRPHMGDRVCHVLRFATVRAPIRFVLGLLAIDAIVVAAFALPARQAASTAAATTTSSATDAGARAAPRVLWKNVDPAALGEKTAAVYVAARRRLGKNKRVILAAPRRVGDDVEIRVSLARLADAKTGLGFPPSTYCFHCPLQRCLFSEPTLEALQTVAEAFRPEEVRELARVAGAEHVEVVYAGGASGGPVVPKAESQSCDGTVQRTDVRLPPAFDIYDDAECGARKCELLGSGETVEVGDGYVDENRKLACLRAMCVLAAGGGMGDLPVKVVGDLAFEQGGAYRGAEVAVALKGVAAAENRDAYAAFWARLTSEIGEEK
jgi:hypothetical protein